MGFAEEIYRLGEVNLFTSNFVIGDVELDRISTKIETIKIEVLHKWLDFRYHFMELDRDWADGKYNSYKRRCIYFLEIVELENFKAITEGLYQSYSKEFPYSKKKDFIKLMFGNTISFLKRFLKLDLIRIGEIELGNESEYIFYMDADDINTEFSDFVIKSKYDIQYYRQYYKTVLKYLKFFKNDNAKLAILPQQTTTENETIRYTAKHYALAYLLECAAKGEGNRGGQKKELEKIGNEKMGAGKGNTFYKGVNKLVKCNLSDENVLIEIGGKNWLEIVKDLCKEPETVEVYLKNKRI